MPRTESFILSLIHSFTTQRTCPLEDTAKAPGAHQTDRGGQCVPEVSVSTHTDEETGPPALLEAPGCLGAQPAQAQLPQKQAVRWAGPGWSS